MPLWTVPASVPDQRPVFTKLAIFLDQEAAASFEADPEHQPHEQLAGQTLPERQSKRCSKVSHLRYIQTTLMPKILEQDVIHPLIRATCTHLFASNIFCFIWKYRDPNLRSWRNFFRSFSNSKLTFFAPGRGEAISLASCSNVSPSRLAVRCTTKTNKVKPCQAWWHD